MNSTPIQFNRKYRFMNSMPIQCCRKYRFMNSMPVQCCRKGRFMNSMPIQCCRRGRFMNSVPTFIILQNKKMSDLQQMAYLVWGCHNFPYPLPLPLFLVWISRQSTSTVETALGILAVSLGSLSSEAVSWFSHPLSSLIVCVYETKREVWKYTEIIYFEKMSTLCPRNFYSIAT